MRMARLRDGAPLLLQHDPDRQIGVIEAVRLDADRVARATVRFSAGPLGAEILADVVDRIRSKVSVTYRVHSMRLESSDDRGDTYRIDDWEPLEISIVSIPADSSVGIGRSDALFPSNPENIMPKQAIETPAAEHEVLQEQAPTARASDPAPLVQDHQPKAAPVNPDAEAIRAVGRHFKLGDLAEDHIMLGGNLEAFRAEVRKHRPDPVPSAPRIEARIPHAGNLRAYQPEHFAGGRREMEETAYRAGQWARAHLFGDEQAARWCRDNGMPVSQRVLTGVGAGQSVIIPDELALPIISLREQYGVARRLCYVHPMATETASVPRDIGDAAAYFVGRESAPTQSEPTFDNVNLTAKNVAAETRISNDYAADSVINLADHVAEKHARAFAVKEDACLINGDGTSTYGGIVGLRTLLTEAGGLAGAVMAASGHDLASEITAVDTRSVVAALPDYPGIDPVWLTSRPLHNLIFGRLADAAGGNRKSELASAMPETWAGYNVMTSAAMPKVATSLDGVAILLFGDFRMGVIFGDRRGMTMMVDPYSLSSYQQVKIISSERFDINCHGVGTTSAAGPIVALVGNA
jgi:HK97 family phage major capsid protein